MSNQLTRTRLAVASLAAAVAVVGSSAEAATPLSLRPVITSGLSQPLFATAPANDPRLFVVEKGGAIKVRQPSGALSTFLDLGGIVNTEGEQGLLGMAFDPGYDGTTNRRFYVNYIDRVTLNTVVARYETSATNPNLAQTGGQQIIAIDQPNGRTNHKAGWIGFRPGDAGNLYVATGDGGGGNDPDNLAQNLNSNLGKILRLNVSGTGAGYTIPAGNPFVGVAGNDEIWAYGLRNPFRNSFDRQTGAFYIADVGQSAREEVDYEAGTRVAGRNYGWRAREGSGDNPSVGDQAPAGAVGPIFEYAHDTAPFANSTGAGNGSITGGYVYRGSLVPDLQGTYFFGDFLNGTVGSFRYDGATLAGLTDRTEELNSRNRLGLFSLASFGEDGFGELYVVDYGGQVYQIVPDRRGWQHSPSAP